VVVMVLLDKLSPVLAILLQLCFTGIKRTDNSSASSFIIFV
jgi:hypothetical protein